jgi:hypothetical protein
MSRLRLLLTVVSFDRFRVRLSFLSPLCFLVCFSFLSDFSFFSDESTFSSGALVLVDSVLAGSDWAFSNFSTCVGSRISPSFTRDQLADLGREDAGLAPKGTLPPITALKVGDNDQLSLLESKLILSVTKRKRLPDLRFHWVPRPGRRDSGVSSSKCNYLLSKTHCPC